MAEPATLDALYDAVFAAVEELGPDGDKSLRAVVEFGGELTPETLSQALSNRLPAALVALAGEDISERASRVTTTGEMQTVLRTSLVVYVAAEAVRGARRVRRPTPEATPKGVLHLVSRVIAATNGLFVEGLWGTARVHCMGCRPQLFRPGPTGSLVVYAVRLQADRIAEQRPLERDTYGETVPFVRADAEVNPIDADPTDDDAALPLAWAHADELAEPPDP